MQLDNTTAGGRAGPEGGCAHEMPARHAQHARPAPPHLEQRAQLVLGHRGVHVAHKQGARLALPRRQLAHQAQVGGGGLAGQALRRRHTAGRAAAGRATRQVLHAEEVVVGEGAGGGGAAKGRQAGGQRRVGRQAGLRLILLDVGQGGAGAVLQAQRAVQLLQVLLQRGLLLLLVLLRRRRRGLLLRRAARGGVHVGALGAEAGEERGLLRGRRRGVRLAAACRDVLAGGAGTGAAQAQRHVRRTLQLLRRGASGAAQHVRAGRPARRRLAAGRGLGTQHCGRLQGRAGR